MTAYVVLRDALLACDVLPELIPGESLPEANRRERLVPLLRRCRADAQVRIVAPHADPVGWALACLPQSERQAKFHDAVLKVLTSGEHPSAPRIQTQLRGAPSRSDALNGEEAKWRAELLLALGWTPPPTDGHSAGRWLPPGKVRHVKHRWRGTDGFVRVCFACGVAQWLERGRWQWAATRDDLSQRIEPVKHCNARGAP